MRHAVFYALIIGTGSAIAQIDSTKIALPTDPGMYIQSVGGFTKIIGQIAQFTRTGSRLVSHATIGIKSAKVNIQLPGPHAQTIVSPQPVFYFIPPRQEAAAGVNAGDFILIRLEEKPQRRQFEIGAAGLFRASSGISLTHQIQILRSEASPGVYMITTPVELNRGEYALYLARGEGLAAYVYDFGVQGTHSAQALQGSRPLPAANVSDFTPHSTADISSDSNDPAGVRAMAASEQTGPKSVVLSEGSASLPAKLTATAPHGGVLGVTGADWQEGGVKGVEIIDAADLSAGRIAGLRKGYVITDVNGVHVASTQDLAIILARLEPGSRISIGYLFKSNLGWMPSETVAILGK
jgi:hypothetical protein